MISDGCEVTLFHSQFRVPGATRGICNNGAVVGYNIGVENDCYTSQLQYIISQFWIGLDKLFLFSCLLFYSHILKNFTYYSFQATHYSFFFLHTILNLSSQMIVEHVETIQLSVIQHAEIYSS